MAKKPSINTITTGYASAEVLNENFEALRNALDNTLSLDGSTPNSMGADLDLNGNSIVGAQALYVGGQDVVSTTAAALAAANLAQADAEAAVVSAESSATSAASSATAAANSASAAATSETNADASADDALASETAAATSATNAANSASAAAVSATSASASATNAATSAANADASADDAAVSATAAASSATAASASADAALAALDSFDDRYLGQKTTDPTLDNDGNPLVAGALYFNTNDGIMKVYDGSLWVAAYASLSGAMFGANNLSDVADASASRLNLGLGTAATTASTDYATAAQGALADSAVQPNDSVTLGVVTATQFLGDGSQLTGLPAGYADSDVDNHLNTGTATTGQVLSWDGADYDWVAVGADLEVENFTATAGQTTFVTSGYANKVIQVFLNGVILTNTVDYTATDNTNVVLTSGAALNDEVKVVKFGSFNVANTYSQTEINTYLSDIYTKSETYSQSEVDTAIAGVGTNLTLTGTPVEDVYAISGTAVALEPDNGSVQTHTLTGNTTYTDAFSAGQAITLMIDDGTAYTITWPTMTWVNNAAAAPTLATTGYTVVALWKVSTTLYGALVGDGS